MVRILKIDEMANTQNSGTSPTAKMKSAFEHFKASLMNGDVEGFAKAMDEFGHVFTDNPETLKEMKYKLEVAVCDPPYVYKKRSGTYYIDEANPRAVERFAKNINDRDRYYPEFSGSSNGTECHSHFDMTCYDDAERAYRFRSGNLITVHGEGAERKFFANIEKECMECAEQYEQHIKEKAVLTEDTLRKYGMENVTDYVNWVCEYIPVILKDSNMKELSLGKNCKCSFWTGSLTAVDAKGIEYRVGGDSTDDDGYIYFTEWKQRGTYNKYHSYAKVTCTIDYDDKKDFSEKIYNYILKLLKSGRLK